MHRILQSMKIAICNTQAIIVSHGSYSAVFTSVPIPVVILPKLHLSTLPHFMYPLLWDSRCYHSTTVAPIMTAAI